MCSSDLEQQLKNTKGVEHMERFLEIATDIMALLKKENLPKVFASHEWSEAGIVTQRDKEDEATVIEGFKHMRNAIGHGAVHIAGGEMGTVAIYESKSASGTRKNVIKIEMLNICHVFTGFLVCSNDQVLKLIRSRYEW